MKYLLLLLLAACGQSCEDKCKLQGGHYAPYDCRKEWVRTDVQPRWCNDNDLDPKRHCFELKDVCSWACVDRKPIPSARTR